MTVLNYSQLIASFPDNVSGLIKPLDMRNFVDSVERKYDNFTVVKPGQPIGNKFPDPVGGKIILPAGSVWIINGAVTTLYPLHLENNVSILGLTSSIITDSLSLDPSAGAVALINSGDSGSGDGYIGTIANVALDTYVSGAGTGRLFNLKNPGVFILSNCVIASESFGSVLVNSSNSEIYFYDIINFISSDSLIFTGSGGGKAIFRNVRSGLGNTGAQFDLTGSVFSTVSISDCYNEAASPMFSVVEGSTPVGAVIGCGVKTGSPFMSGVNTSSINWTFAGNSGIENTVPVGGLGIDANATVTDLLGVDLWAIVAGTSVLSSSSRRFDRPSPSTLRYIGKEAFRGVASCSISITPTNNPASIYEVGLFKNGVLYTDGGISYRTSASLSNGVRQSLSFVVPVTAALNDTFDIRVRNRTSAVPDIVSTELNFCIK